MASLPRPFLSTDVNYVVRHYGDYNVYRFLADDGKNYHFIGIGKFVGAEFKPLPPPKTKMGHRVKWSVRTVRELKLDQPFSPECSPEDAKDNYDRVIADVGIPAQLNEEIPAWAKESSDKSRETVNAIWAKWKFEVITSDAAYSDAVKEGMVLSGLTAPSVRRLIAVHFFYGGHPNACLDHYWLKGGAGISRRDAVYDDGTRIDVGRPTTAQKRNPKTIAKKRPLTKRRLGHYTRFIISQAKTNETLAELNNRYRTNVFAYTSKKKLEGDEKTTQMRVHDRHIPPNSALSRVGGPLLKLVRLQHQQANRYVPGERLTSGGSSQMLVDDEHVVWDLDATMPKNYLVLDDKYQTPIKGLTQPYIFFSVCRRSSAIVGYYVTFGFENGRSYLSLMWSSYLDKEDELKRWGVPELEGMVHGVTNAVIVDRGPARREKVQEIFTENMRITVLFAEPGRGENKGPVEVRHSLAQKDMRHLPGSTQPVDRASENRRRAKKVRKGDCITLREFMQHLLKFISAHNLRVNPNIILTQDMERIPQVPKEVFNYIQNKRFGHQAMRMPKDMVYKLFCIRHPMSSKDGCVTLASRTFHSPELEKVAGEHYHLYRKPLDIQVLEAPAQPLTLLWERATDGALIRLEADYDTSLQFGDTFRWEHDEAIARRIAKNQEHAAKEAARATKKYNANVDRGLISEAAQSEMAASEKRATVHPGQPEKRRAVRKVYTNALSNEDVDHALNSIQGGKFPDLQPGTSSGDGDFYDDDSDYSGLDDNQDLGV